MSARDKHRVYVVHVKDEEGEPPALMVANTRYGRVIGAVPCAPSSDELQKLARYRVLHQERPLYVFAGVGDRGKLIDPVLIGFEDSVEKVAAAASDPLTEAATEWKKSNYSKKNLPKVVVELRKVVAGRAQDFASRGGTAIPQAEFMKAGLKALKKYDPNKGARASTFVVSSLKEAHRPLLQRATPVRIPEQRLQQVGSVQRAEQELIDLLGRSPTPKEVAKRSKVSEKTVNLLKREVQPIHMNTLEEVPHGDKPSQLKEVWELLAPELKGNELGVYQYLNRNPSAKNAEISRKLRISASQVSRYRQNLRRRVMGHVQS